MKNATASIIPNTTDIRAKRRDAKREVRIVASNVRATAHSTNTGPIRLARTAHVRPARMLLAWFGLRLGMTDFHRIMLALNMTPADMFEGTSR